MPAGSGTQSCSAHPFVWWQNWNTLYDEWSESTYYIYLLITVIYSNREMLNSFSFKVYYIPVKVFYNQCVLPTMICSIPLIRYIFIREEIQIVHGHSAFSALAHEGMLIGRLMGLKVSRRLLEENGKLYSNYIWNFRPFLQIIRFSVSLTPPRSWQTNF